MNTGICSNCVMDVSAKEISFDEKGVCNFCRQAQQSLQEIKDQVFPLPSGNQYDCLIGLSGGVDSSYALHLAVTKYHLRPLCFSIDTGYNKPAADENIMKLVEGLQVPFFRYVIDLEKFRELQGAFLKSGVRNVEIPTDHVLMAASLEMASTNRITTILSGGNVNTESIMPPSWGYNARDLTHIKDIFKKFTNKKLTGLPMCGIWKWNWYRWVKKIKTVYILDYNNYNRSNAESILENKYGFKSTGEKHEENYFTWWFQNYYLFTKFGIDKRKAHYSSMINSGQMSRQEAFNKLHENPIYPELGLERKVLKYPKHQHEDYAMDKWYGRIASTIKWLS